MFSLVLVKIRYVNKATMETDEIPNLDKTQTSRNGTEETFGEEDNGKVPEDLVNYKEKYRTLKRKLKCLLYVSLFFFFFETFTFLDGWMFRVRKINGFALTIFTLFNMYILQLNVPHNL